MLLKVVSHGHPDAELLIEAGRLDMLARYAYEDRTPVHGEDFSPPHGRFVVAYLDGTAVGCGGWRVNGRKAEIKRMYVAPAARRRGIAKAVLANLEEAARTAGRTEIILETGVRQPEALALYRSSGYLEIPAFGYHTEDAESVYLGKLLR
ncbi:GNAT family N-acetyltransferase [Streptomyces sp. Lzd4kr]|nr:GNAT family N-acetyltransferase [Streptomyces sp. Lzd4kr]